MKDATELEKIRCQESGQETSPAASLSPADNNPMAAVAEVSHELRLPIANIKLLIETLLDGAMEDKEVCQRMLRRSHQEIERLHALVENLLALEQNANNRFKSDRTFVSLAVRAALALETVSTIANQKNVHIHIAVPAEFFIYANEEQLDQVLLNMLENAVKFTPPNGTVRITAGPEEGGFSIIDSGIGIPAGEIPKIFQRFYRIDRKQSKGGTGLGLSIVKHILDLHGGKISVFSEEGKGTQFHLHFPGPA